MNPTNIRVRFAPSPTGYLHVGGARTAIFNWLFARRFGGTFLIRIEDTDPVRSRGELSQIILDGLKWLGMESDEAIVFQSDHTEQFVKVAHELVNRGAAYFDFTTKEELEEMRRLSQQRKEPAFRFTADREKVKAETAERLSKGDPYAIRFIAPNEGLSWKDLVHGTVSYAGEDLDDFVLLRSDGSPTYHLSVVCDDHDMDITHVLRGDDHISNTPKQIALYRAMNWKVPEFGHVPLILGPDKKRLSKRMGAASVGEFLEKGFLPEALFNFLTLIGWSPGPGDQEIFSREELKTIFDLSGIQTKSAVFDEAKLEWMNGEHLKKLSDRYAVEHLMSYASGENRVLVERAWPLVTTRVRLPKDLFEGHSYLFQDPETFDETGVQKQFADSEMMKRVGEYTKSLENFEPFSPIELEQQLRTLCEGWGIKAGVLIHPVRLALTGKTVSPGLFELMYVLGKETVLRRLRFAVEKFSTPLSSPLRQGGDS